MLSYQHAFHAGNLADLHKHGLLAWMLGYLTQKDKPLTYIETHAGRGLYDLTDASAQKTGEAAKGIDAHSDWFADDHPMTVALSQCRDQHGASAYPGSPALADILLRSDDHLHLAELHPTEHAALRQEFGRRAKVYCRDGFETAHALTPPTPRRGILLIDPPYEVKSDYSDIPHHIAKITRAWNVGTVALWYPILMNKAHSDMCAALSKAHKDALRHEVSFPPARPGHGMVGSGMFVINPPYGLDHEAARLSAKFAALR